MAGEETIKKIKDLVSPDSSAVNMNNNVAQTGLNMDQSVNQIGQGSLTYALNAAVENFDANSVNYQNEPGNEFCVEFPLGFSLIGEHSIYEQNKHIFFLVNPETGDSEIGYTENNNCQYQKYIGGKCLNFNIDHPIHKVVHKITNCTVEIYWTDGINPRRYLDLSLPPYKTQPSPTDPCEIETLNEIDCNKLKLQPNFKIPQVEVVEIRNGGELVSGTYQFAIQYCDSSSNAYTSYYSITNPTPIADNRVSTLDFNYKVGNSIVINIDNLDTTGYYKYFNLAVIKTVNNASSVELIGTYFIDKSSEKIIYSGQRITNIELTILDIFEKFPYYDIAQDLTSVQDILVWDNLTSIDRINYQQIASQITLQWQTYKLPANENYADELNATNLRGYLRDEVYAFEIVFLLKNGKQTDGFHIPGRQRGPIELTSPDVPNTNADFIESGTSAPYWKIYNTATDLGTATGNNIGNAVPHRYGEFAYWESEEEYPCNKDVWGILAGQKIRHHKFPDVLVSPIFESNLFTTANSMVMSSNSVFPIGVKIDPNLVRNYILSSNLTSEQKSDIIGFKIVRGDRNNHKSIIGKGILRNVGSYNREGTDYYFPNYPYNDLKVDPFLMTSNNAYVSGNSSSNNNIRCRSYTIHAGKNELVIVEYIDCKTNTLAKLEIDNRGNGSTLTRNICTLSFPGPSVTKGRAFVTGNTYARYKITAANGDFKVVPPRVPKSNVNTGGVNFHYFNEPIPRGNVCGNFNPCSSGTWPDGELGWNEQCLYGCDGSSCDDGLDVAYRCSAVLKEVVYKNVSKFDLSGSGADLGRSFYVDSLIEPACVGGQCAPDKFTIEKIDEFDTDDCKIEPLEAFKDVNNKYRLIFNSPETSFGKPFLGSVLKLENVIFGAGQAHFVQVKDNAFYKFLTKEAQEDAYKSSTDIAPGNISARFAAYQSYLTIYVNGITRRNYSWSFNSIAKYSYHDKINNNLGIKQRLLDIAQYINPTVQSVNDTIDINNWNRESSVYLRTDLTRSSLLFPKETPSINPSGTSPLVEDNSRFVNSDPRSDCNNPGTLVKIDTIVYYASLKNIQPSQYGQIYQYTTIDTGYQVDIPSISSSTKNVIFGGDTFICNFAFKTKLPFFIENRVGAPDDSDVFYDELGNVAYPKYWHSSRSILANAGALTNFISYKALNLDCPNSQVSSFGALGNPGRTYYDGKMYQFAYGIPSFYCESSINIDLRQAFNDREGDFWPHVSTGIPDDWVQESRVPIVQDNTYYYNATFSKQNKENFFSHLPVNWEPKLCFTNYPFRTIYSDRQQSYVDNQINNWLIYRPVSVYDFPQNYGRLISLDGIQNRAVLARFENKTLLYNKLLTVDTSNPQAAYLGNSNLFEGAPPVDFAETDLGYVGCQNKMLLKIPQGQITIDAKRGQVFLLTNEGATDLSAFGSGMNRFFTDHLAFEILRYFPDLEEVIDGERILVKGVNTDNHFNGIGLHGVYDSKYDRVIITKLDYVPLSDDVKYDYDTKDFYVEETLNGSIVRTIIYLTDVDYFCNKSWTLSFNLNTKTWVSFHSYLPNFYIAENNFFYSGLNGCCDGLSISSFNAFDSIVTSGLSEVIPRTTTTTSTPAPLPPFPSLDCSFSGIAQYNCIFEIEATVYTTTTTTTTLCPPISDSIAYLLVNGYTIDSTTVDSTSSLQSACDAAKYVNLFPENCLFSFTDITVYSQTSLVLNAFVYQSSCDAIPNGWYFINDNGLSNSMYHIIGGFISEISSCECTVVETTTALPPNIEECCSKIYTTNNSIIYYNQSIDQNFNLNIPGFVLSSYGASLNSEKFWAINTQINEWDITLAPFSATFNRDIAFPGGFTTSSGIVAINNTTLIAVNSTPAPQKVVELDITTLTASLTNKFDLQADRVAIGNPLYTIDGKFIIINQDSISSDYYISQYDYSTGSIEVDFNIESFAPVGIYYCDCVIQLIGENSEVKILVSTPGPEEFVLVTSSPGDSSTSIGIITQHVGCIAKSLTEPTTTTTTTVSEITYCYSVDFLGNTGTFNWLNALGEGQSTIVNNGDNITVCAQNDSFFSEGDISYDYCTDYVICTDCTECPNSENCPTTTTTSSTSTSTTTSTTTQEPTTTTSTTTEELTTTTTTTTP